MKRNIIHCIVVCLAAFTLPFMIACSSQEEPFTNTEAATLYMNIAILEQAQYEGATLPDNEKMHTLRVVVLHGDGKVEHNRFYSLDGAKEEKFIILKVKPNEKKRFLSSPMKRVCTTWRE